MFSYTVFIPRVFSNIKEERIVESFDYLEIGSVDRVDLVRKTGKNGETYNMAFVHFAMVYDTEAAANFRSDLEGPEKKTKVTYDGQWFWVRVCIFLGSKIHRHGWPINYQPTLHVSFLFD